ncbi:MAG: hypothetical protein ABIK89_05035 [Planctomycetota bacterium]
MKTKPLLQAIEMLYPAVADKPLVPEMGDLRIKDQSIVATDGLVWTRVALEESSGVDCRAPAEKLLRLLRSLTAEDVELKQDAGNLIVEAGRVVGTFSVSTEPSMLDELDFEVEAWVPIPADFLEGIKLCRFAASRDASQGAVSGVLLTKGRAVASDGFKIAVRFCKGSPPADGPVVLSGELADYIASVAAEVESWAVRGETALFRLKGGAVIGGKTLTGQFPDLSEPIKAAKALDGKLELPEDVSASLRRHIGQLDGVPEHDRQVTVAAEGGELIVSSTDGATYKLRETLVLEKPMETPVSFQVNPTLLTEIVGRTRTMGYDEKSPFVAFGESSGLLYLVAVTRS